MELVLESGRVVWAKYFTYGETYGGLLEGKPNRRMHQQMVDREKCPQDWGVRKTYLIPPSEEELNDWLPPAVYKVWLWCSEPIDESRMGSELVVIWFGPPPEENPIRTIIQMGVTSIDWETHAEDFDY